MKYRKKPVVVEAIQWNGDNFVEIDEFIDTYHETYPKNGVVIIANPVGMFEAFLGDYIIKDTLGQFYPMRQKAFEETYERI